MNSTFSGVFEDLNKIKISQGYKQNWSFNNETLDHTPLWSQNLMKYAYMVSCPTRSKNLGRTTVQQLYVKRCSIMRVTESIEAWPQIARYCSSGRHHSLQAAAPPESSVQSSTNHFYALMCFIYFVLLFIFETNWFSHGFLNCRSLRLDNVFEGYSKREYEKD